MKAVGRTINKKEKVYKGGQTEIITKENGAMGRSKVKGHLFSQMAVHIMVNSKETRSTVLGSTLGTNPAHMKVIGSTIACKAKA